MADMLDVQKYKLEYTEGKEEAAITIFFKEDGEERSYTMMLEPDDAVFVADMLRNEKPIRWYPDSKTIGTGKEPVGEEESEFR